MNDYIFILNYPASNGLTCADVILLTKGQFMNKVLNSLPRSRKRVRLGTFDCKYTKSIVSVNLTQFKQIFNNSDIETMKQNGMLDYFPNRRSLSLKYPLFRAEIYKKFGIAKEK